MSDTLADFARPLLDRLPDDAVAEDWELALSFASLVWNNVVNGKKASKRLVSIARQTLAAVRLREDEAAAVVDELVERKSAIFADDDRFIAGVTAYLEGGMLRIFAASARP